MTPQPTTPADRPPVVTPPAATERPSGPPFPFPAPRREMTDDELERWAGQHVAWSWDGTTILAGAETPGELYQLLDRAGVNTSRVVFDYVDEPGATYL
ncbi:MAG: hypothetical protein K2X87_04640 [Gemmataceae bacterium]|nr:hypothetical protein [Gemmataceae bacterium]